MIRLLLSSIQPVLLTLLLVPQAMWSTNSTAGERSEGAGEARTEDKSDQLIKQLARPAPATIAFTEIRLSPLLKQPLLVSGELGYSGPTSLDRRVLHPYREYTTIRGESVRVEREGEPVRTFALKRAPELRGLLNGFGALLSGDATALRRSFDIEAQISADNTWTITMTPLDAKARRRIKQLSAVGLDDQPRCLSLAMADGGTSIMLLGTAASQAIPAPTSVAQLDVLCRSGANP